MKIVRISAKDFMILRDVSLALKEQGLMQITGKNGQGKSTLLRFVEWMLAGPTAIPMKQKKSVVRRGAMRAWGELEMKDPKIGHFVVTRSWTTGNTQDLDIWEWRDNKPYERVRNQQAWLKQLFTGLSFDPLAFAQMDTEDQITELKRLAHVDLDFPALAAADAEDMAERKAIKVEVKQLETRLGDIDVVLEGLPEKKIDEAAIFARITQASELFRAAQEIDRAKQELGAAAAKLGAEKIEADRHIVAQADKIANLTAELAAAKHKLAEMKTSHVDLDKRHKSAEKAFEAAPVGQTVDVNTLTQELQKAQRTNRAIDTRAQWDKLNQDLEQKRRAVAVLDERIEARDQLRARAVADAKLPVKDLTFDETQVLYKGLPLANQGEGDQIRISTLLGIAMNPGLRAMCIQHGEALDEDGLKLIEDLALEHDVQILMARVESSGKVGIVIEAGHLVANNEKQKLITGTGEEKRA